VAGEDDLATVCADERMCAGSHVLDYPVGTAFNGQDLAMQIGALHGRAERARRLAQAIADSRVKSRVA
jgi:hypothetical protein